MVDSHAENVVIKENWYDLNKYKDELTKFIKDKKRDLGRHSSMLKNYNILYRSIFAGAEESDEERFPFAKEMFNTMKSILIEACVPGYSAIMECEGRNSHSILEAPKLKKVMTDQFKNIALIEKITDKAFFDWFLKGEVCAFIKLKQTTERYREKETLSDEETGEKILSFKVETGVTYEDLDVEFIDPLDLYIDAIDYEQDPKGCPKMIRSYISSRELLTNKTNYKLLSDEDKQAIIKKYTNKDTGYPFIYASPVEGETFSKTSDNQIEVITYRGDYVTNDGKLLTNIKCIVVEGYLAFLDYAGVDTLQLIYAPYIVDRETHRGVSPLCSSIPMNRLANRCTDLFLSNLDEVNNPILMYQVGSLPPNEEKTFRDKRELQYNGLDGELPTFYNPPEISPNGISLLQLVLEQSKEMMGVNKYIAGDASGSVRTAQESQILFQKANARMRVETDVFSYKFLLPLVSNFYAFNRELAITVGHPLNEIYADPDLMVTFTTGAGKADKEGELNRLMQMLQLPIAQMIFSNLDPRQTALAVRYLMAKADLTDADNLLELIDEQGNTAVPPEEMGVPPMENPGEQNIPEEQPAETISPEVEEMMNTINQEQGGQ